MSCVPWATHGEREAMVDPRCPTHQNSFRTMFGMIFQLQNKSLHHFLSFRNKLTLFLLKTYVKNKSYFLLAS